MVYIFKGIKTSFWFPGILEKNVLKVETVFKYVSKLLLKPFRKFWNSLILTLKSVSINNIYNNTENFWPHFFLGNDFVENDF